MSRNKPKLKLGILIFILISIYLNLIIQLINQENIALGIKLANISLAGEKNISQEKLKKNWQDFSQQTIQLKYQNKIYQTNLKKSGIELNIQKIINIAYQQDKKNFFFKNLLSQYQALLGQIKIKPSYKIDLEKFRKETDKIFQTIEKPAQNANLEFNSEKNKFILIPSAKGIIINRQKLLLQLKAKLENFQNKPIKLDLISDFPNVENHEIEIAQEKAQKIIDHQPYYLIFENWTYKIPLETLIDWLEFKPITDLDNPDNKILGVEINKDKVKEYLAKIAKNINRPYTDAELEIKDNRAVKFTPPSNGFEVKQNRTYDQLVNNLKAEEPINKTYIIADTAKPKITLNMTNHLGINQLISQGYSNYAGSSSNRIHNIKTGANQINGYILKPEEELSFNQLIPETTAETGYLPEHVIKNKKTILEYGGGLCQVSTTLFRAAINAGLNITKRHAHAFPVSYYNPQGFDATVYSPWVDLKFINNTPNHILIYAYTSGYNLYFNFYGTDDNRQVQVKGPWILEKNEDGSMKTILKMKVYQDNHLTHQQDFYSSYKSPDLYPVE